MDEAARRLHAVALVRPMAAHQRDAHAALPPQPQQRLDEPSAAVRDARVREVGIEQEDVHREGARRRPAR
jgi:hypothetical protein